MTKIFKYPLEFSAEKMDIKVRMPLGAKVLSVGLQRSGIFNDEGIVIWAEVDDINTTDYRYFSCVLTGQNFSLIGWRFVGTVQFTNGIVAHIYEA